MGNFINVKIWSCFFACVFILMAPKSNATIFQKMPLAKLVEESTGGAEVVLKEKKSFMNKMGVIMTDYFFQVDEAYNLENSDYSGSYLKISLIGGTVDGVTSYIDGAPEFNKEEKSFLLLKKIDSKIYLSNFAMGKYKVEERDGKIIYVSTVFPEDSDIGRVPKEKMIELLKLKEIKKENSRTEKNNSAIEVKKEVVFAHHEKMRNPAQNAEDFENNHEGALVMWGFLVLFGLSGITIWWKLKQGVRE